MASVPVILDAHAIRKKGAALPRRAHVHRRGSAPQAAHATTPKTLAFAALMAANATVSVAHVRKALHSTKVQVDAEEKTSAVSGFRVNGLRDTSTQDLGNLYERGMSRYNGCFRFNGSPRISRVLVDHTGTVSRTGGIVTSVRQVVIGGRHGAHAPKMPPFFAYACIAKISGLLPPESMLTRHTSSLLYIYLLYFTVALSAA